MANEAPLLSGKHRDTRLLVDHFWMTVMFLAQALSTITGFPIHIIHPYGMEEDMDGWRVADATNV